MKPQDMLLAIAVAVLWGMGFVIAKSALAHFPPIFLMALRFALSAACVVWFFRPPWALMKHIFWIALIGATLEYALIFTGLAHLDVSTATLLVQLEAPFGIFLGWMVFRERIGARRIGGIALALAGVGGIAGAPDMQASLPHAAMVVGGAFTWALGQILVKRLGRVDGLPLVGAIALMAAPQLFLVSLLLESGQLAAVRSATPAMWAAVAYLGLAMTILAYAIWYHLLGRYPVSRVMPFLLLLPLVAVAGGVWFFDERLSVNTIAGGLCVLIGVGIINMREPSRHPAINRHIK
ncbi:MAG: EamA family transporter [Gammaproteobacteria bacterium]